MPSLSKVSSVFLLSSTLTELASAGRINTQNIQIVQDKVSSSEPRPVTEEEQEVWVSLHNSFRCMHGAKPVEWDDKLAEGAAEYVKSLTQINGNSPGAQGAKYGENFAISSEDLTPESVVQRWYDEKKHCEEQKESQTDIDCVKDVRHIGGFSALIWADVTKIGCAWSDGDKPRIATCRYQATPNRVGPGVDWSKFVQPKIKSKAECRPQLEENDIIYYQWCVPPGSRKMCETCTHDVQCKEGFFCHTALKLCSKNEDSCAFGNHPMAGCMDDKGEGTCKGDDDVDVTECECEDPNFPSLWLGERCPKGTTATTTTTTTSKSEPGAAYGLHGSPLALVVGAAVFGLSSLNFII